MITPAGFRGTAFTTAPSGDMRHAERLSVSTALGIDSQWATATQVHGAHVAVVSTSGGAGEADGVLTTTSGVPVAVFTADCGGIVLEAPGAVAAVHAGWRGAAAGVVRAAGDALEAHGGVERAALGPTIGPCCFEVGDEVAEQFPDHVSTTSWGTTSVDLRAAIRAQLDTDWWTSDVCTMCGDDTFSYRRDGATERLAAIGWLP